MRIFTLIIFLSVLTNIAKGQILKSIKVFYYDDQTFKGKKTYLELKTIGEDPWSKPEKIDIVMSINKHSAFPSDRLEILIEELYEPTNLKKNSLSELNDRRWVPHEIVYSNVIGLIKGNMITIKNWPYQTAYFTDSMLYVKHAFRIVGIFYNKKLNKIERIMKTFNYE